MSAFPWKSSYAVGDELIDSQHRQLLAVANSLQQSMLADYENEDAIYTAFEALRNYIDVHFVDEERLWERLNSPKIESHKAAHDELRLEFEDLWADYMADEGSPDALSNWVKTRLVHHMITVDKIAFEAASC